MTCGCNDKCELPKALQINNPGEVTLFHRVDIPASQGDDETYPPKNGLYRNVLLVYLANNHSYLYNSDGIPTRVDGPAGPGTAAGGETGQILAKRSDADYDTTWITQTSANDATLTISRNDTPVGTFTANASVDKTIDIEVPTKTSDLENDGATGDSTYVETTALADYYTKSESDSTFQDKLTAGSNITIDANNEISATDTTYTAGEGININGTTIAAKVRRVYNYYTSRPASANTTATGNGGMFTFQATSNMTTGKPKNDASILQLEWDSNAGHDTQLAMTPGVHGSWLAHRHQNSGTWGSWIYVLDDVAGSVKTTNIDALAVTTAKIANGAVTEAKINATDWAKKVNVANIDLTGQTVDLLTLTKALGAAGTDYARWTCRYNSGAANISNKPTGSDNESFVCEAYCSRRATSSDYRYNLIAWSTVSNNPYVAYVTNSSSSIAWDRLRPEVNDATLTITQNGTSVGTFTANSSTNKTANITVPTKTSDLTNDGATGTSTYVETDELVPDYITGEGTDIALPNTQGGRFSDVKLKGDTEQTTYSGKNLFNLTTPATNNGVTVTTNADGSFTVNGTTTGVATFTFQLPTPQPAGTYTISCTSKNQVMDNAGFFIRARNVNQAMLVNGESQLRGNDSYYGTKTFTSTDQMYYVALNLTATGVTYNNMVIYPQIERASAATDFEPYVGGTASPNPNYPQDVQVVTGEQTVKITGKNLFNIQGYYDGIANDKRGATVALNDGNIVWTNTANDSYFPSIWNYRAFSLHQDDAIPVESNTTYTLSFAISGNISNGAVYIYEGDASYNGINNDHVGQITNVHNATLTFTTSATTKFIIVRFARWESTSHAVTVSDIQLEKGSTATDFEPYQSQTYTINLGKNLLDTTVTQPGFINASGNYQANANSQASVFIEVLPNTTYTASATATYRFIGFAEYTSEKAFIGSIQQGGNTTSYSITTTAATKFIRVFYNKDSGITAQTLRDEKAQIEIGPTRTGYVLYADQIELCKIGTYQDYIYKNNGTWYLHKATDRTIDNGTKTYQARTNTSATHSKFYVSTDDLLNYPIAGTTTLVSDHFIANIGANDAAYSGSASCGSTASGYTKRLWYSVPNSIATTPEAFKTWIAANPVTTYYAMSTPIDTPITGTLLDDLNAFDQATSYQGDTYITVSSVSPDLPAILSVTTEEEGILPTATETSAGVVSVGDGLKVTEGGVLSLADNVVYSEAPGTPIGEVVNPFDYSTTETRIGTWIDGKPLYRKAFSGTASSSNTSLAIGTNDIATVVKVDVLRTITSTTTDTVGSYYVSSTDYFRYWVRKTQSDVYQVELRSAANAYRYTMVIEYTKTTD